MTTPYNSVRDQEIKQFNALADQWWDLQGPMRMLHKINPLRMRYVLQQLGSVHPKQTTLLDVGCGGGIFSHAAAQAHFKVTAIDASPAVIEVAQHKAKQDKLSINYHHASAEQFDAQSKKRFAVITCFELLEHVEQPEKLIAILKHLLAPKGMLIVSTINRHPKAFLQAIVAAEFILKWLPKGTHHYAQFIRPSELVQWCRLHQLHLQDLTGMTYHPLTQSFSLTQSMSVNYFACFQKPA